MNVIAVPTPRPSALAEAVTTQPIDILLREPISHDEPTSALGWICGTVQRQSIAAHWQELRFALACHPPSEFPAYGSSPIDREEEPLFALWLKPRLIEHFAVTPTVALGKCLHGMMKGSCSLCEPSVRPAKVQSKTQKRINPLRTAALNRPASRIKLGKTPEASVWPERWYVGGPRWVKNGTRIQPTAVLGEYLNHDHPAWCIRYGSHAGQIVPKPRLRPGQTKIKLAIVSPDRCPHGLLSKSGEVKSTICHACKFGYPAWELTRKPLNAEQISRVESISGDSSPIEKPLEIFVAPPDYTLMYRREKLHPRKPRVIFERGRVIVALSGRIEQWMVRSQRPIATVDWVNNELSEAYRQWDLTRPCLKGLVTSSEVCGKRMAETYRTQPSCLFNHYRNWCANCLEYLPLGHDAADGTACEEYQQQRPLEVQYAAEKTAAALATFLARYEAKREKERAKESELQQLAYSLGDEWCATHPKMAAHLTFPDFEAIEHVLTAKDLIGGTKTSTHSWSEHDQKGNGDDEKQKVNYSDKNTRDYRSNVLFKKQRPERHLPKAFLVCQHCGKSFYNRKGTKFCQGNNCRQRQWDEEQKTETEITQ